MAKKDIYELIEKMGGEDIAALPILLELIQWLNSDTLSEFTDDFKRLHSIE